MEILSPNLIVNEKEKDSSALLQFVLKIKK